MHLPSNSEMEILDQIAANLQRMEWAAAAIGQQQLSNLIDLALLEAIDLLITGGGTAALVIAAPLPASAGEDFGGTLENEKLRENRLRRAAKRGGLRLLKSRIRDAKALGFGGFMLVEIHTKAPVLGDQPYAFSCNLEAVEGFLNR